MEKKDDDRIEVFEKALKDPEDKRYVLRLYVAGTTPRSTQSIINIKKICEEHLKGRYELEVIDIYQQPLLARADQIIAVPTLVKELPPPLRKFIGNMADVEHILIGFDIKPRDEAKETPGKGGHE